MKKLLITIALGAHFRLRSCARAGHGGGNVTRPARKRSSAPTSMFQMIDANHDGTVTKAEADQALAQFQASRGDKAAVAAGGFSG